MKLRIAIAALLTFGVGLMPAHAESESAPTAAQREDDRRILVMLKLGPTHYRPGADYGGSGYGDSIGQAARRRLAERIASEHHLKLVDNWAMQIVGVDCVIMTVPDDRSLESVTDELSTLPTVAWSQPLNKFHLESAPHDRTSNRPNDRLFRAQPAAIRWRLADLHRMATGRGVTIAVVDSRIDAAHPDLSGQIARVANFVDDNRRGAERHGTGIAGIIAARTNNQVGIAGVAPGARVLGLRACWERSADERAICDSISLARALSYAIENHANVINLSLSGPDDRLIETLIRIAMSRGSTVVVAVDEARADNGFPATVPGVIPVADESLSSNRAGVYIAPGTAVPTTEPGGKWDLVDGSSYAAAHVSGLVALVQQVNRANGRPNLAGSLGRSGPIDACAVLTRAASVTEDRCAQN